MIVLGYPVESVAFVLIFLRSLRALQNPLGRECLGRAISCSPDGDDQSSSVPLFHSQPEKSSSTSTSTSFSPTEYKGIFASWSGGFSSSNHAQPVQFRNSLMSDNHHFIPKMKKTVWKESPPKASRIGPPTSWIYEYMRAEGARWSISEDPKSHLVRVGTIKM